MGSSKRAAVLAHSLKARIATARFPLSGSAERGIQRRVWAYADTLKELGLPPERVVVAVKRVARSAAVPPTSRITSFPMALDGRDKLLVDMVGWCIEGYYDTRRQPTKTRKAPRTRMR